MTTKRKYTNESSASNSRYFEIYVNGDLVKIVKEDKTAVNQARAMVAESLNTVEVRDKNGSVVYSYNPLSEDKIGDRNRKAMGHKPKRISKALRPTPEEVEVCLPGIGCMRRAQAEKHYPDEYAEYLKNTKGLEEGETWDAVKKGVSKTASKALNSPYVAGALGYEGMKSAYDNYQKGNYGDLAADVVSTAAMLYPPTRVAGLAGSLAYDTAKAFMDADKANQATESLDDRIDEGPKTKAIGDFLGKAGANIKNSLTKLWQKYKNQRQDQKPAAQNSTAPQRSPGPGDDLIPPNARVASSVKKPMSTTKKATIGGGIGGGAAYVADKLSSSNPQQSNNVVQAPAPAAPAAPAAPGRDSESTAANTNGRSAAGQSFDREFAAQRAAGASTFDWTNPNTGKTGTYHTRLAGEPAPEVPAAAPEAPAAAAAAQEAPAAAAAAPAAAAPAPAPAVTPAAPAADTSDNSGSWVDRLPGFHAKTGKQVGFDKNPDGSYKVTQVAEPEPAGGSASGILQGIKSWANNLPGYNATTGIQRGFDKNPDGSWVEKDVGKPTPNVWGDEYSYLNNSKENTAKPVNEVTTKEDVISPKKSVDDRGLIVKTVDTPDGKLNVLRNKNNKFKISTTKGKQLPALFNSLEEATMAIEVYCGHKKNQLTEKETDTPKPNYKPNANGNGDPANTLSKPEFQFGGDPADKDKDSIFNYKGIFRDMIKLAQDAKEENPAAGNDLEAILRYLNQHRVRGEREIDELEQENEQQEKIIQLLQAVRSDYEKRLAADEERLAADEEFEQTLKQDLERQRQAIVAILDKEKRFAEYAKQMAKTPSEQRDRTWTNMATDVASGAQEPDINKQRRM